MLKSSFFAALIVASTEAARLLSTSKASSRAGMSFELPAALPAVPTEVAAPPIPAATALPVDTAALPVDTAALTAAAAPAQLPATATVIEVPATAGQASALTTKIAT